MDVPTDLRHLDTGWLNGLLERCEAWPHGALAQVRVARIGAERGYAGWLGRVSGVTADGASASCVVKIGSSEATQRSLLAHGVVEPLLERRIPRCHGGVGDPASGRGALVFEDLTEAEPGDVLAGCRADRAHDIMRLLARLHGSTWAARRELLPMPAGLPEWDPHPLAPERWSDRLRLARQRYPDILGAELAQRLTELPTRFPNAVASARTGPFALIHADVHLDNVLFPRDGSVVLLDWDGACEGPPGVDVVRAVLELGLGGSQPTPGALMATYMSALRECGVRDVALPDILGAGTCAVVPLIQGVIAWAGKDTLGQAPVERFDALREDILRKLCAFLDGDHPGLPRMAHPGRAAS